MTGKIALAAFTAMFVVLQCYLLYVLQHGGTGQFAGLWQAFGVAQTSYSAFVFRTLRWWWSLPVLCSVLAAYALGRASKAATAVALVAGFGGFMALCWAVYAPALMVHV
jgi:hypothetical protein